MLGHADLNTCLLNELYARPAEAIGHLGYRLRPLLVRGPPNSNNMLYNITFSSRKKEKNKKKGPFFTLK